MHLAVGGRYERENGVIGRRRALLLLIMSNEAEARRGQVGHRERVHSTYCLFVLAVGCRRRECESGVLRRGEHEHERATRHRLDDGGEEGQFACAQLDAVVAAAAAAAAVVTCSSSEANVNVRGILGCGGAGAHVREADERAANTPTQLTRRLPHALVLAHHKQRAVGGGRLAVARRSTRHTAAGGGGVLSSTLLLDLVAQTERGRALHAHALDPAELAGAVLAGALRRRPHLAVIANEKRRVLVILVVALDSTHSRGGGRIVLARRPHFALGTAAVRLGDEQQRARASA